jgi:hypothetical protein
MLNVNVERKNDEIIVTVANSEDEDYCVVEPNKLSDAMSYDWEGQFYSLFCNLSPIQKQASVMDIRSRLQTLQE